MVRRGTGPPTIHNNPCDLPSSSTSGPISSAGTSPAIVSTGRYTLQSFWPLAQTYNWTLYHVLLSDEPASTTEIDGKEMANVIESIVNHPIRLMDDSSRVSGVGILPVHEDKRFTRFRLAPVALNLLNVNENMSDSSLTAVEADKDSGVCRLTGQPLSPYERLRSIRGWTALVFDASDEETRVDERHPLVGLNVALINEWCLLNLIDFHDMDRTFSS